MVNWHIREFTKKLSSFSLKAMTIMKIFSTMRMHLASVNFFHLSLKFQNVATCAIDALQLNKFIIFLLIKLFLLKF
jgi:hypothetical protein